MVQNAGWKRLMMQVPDHDKPRYFVGMIMTSIVVIAVAAATAGS